MLIIVFVFLHGAIAQFDDRLIQTFEDAVENGTISESCQESLQLYLGNLLSITDMWALRSKYDFFILYFLRENKKNNIFNAALFIYFFDTFLFYVLNVPN